ncbi:MAG: pyridoxamine 5'-phosphate oxidase [Bdellovibrionales bacterium]
MNTTAPPAKTPNPFAEFQIWHKRYADTKPREPNSAFLSTSDRQGVPSGRVILFKTFDEKGILFFTNYDSRKGRDLSDNPQAALTFYWDSLHQQVRMFGSVSRLTAFESDQYFKSRPYESQISAWASRQGQRIENREYLEKQFAEYKKKYPTEVPRPDYWGGYRLVPSRVEFWMGRDNRLHDRMEYVFEGGKWKIQRLSP